MAGRPMRKAKQVTALEAKMVEVRELMDEVCELFDGHMPDRYHDRTPAELSRDPRGKAWVDASEAIDDASDRLGDLGVMLREKAGITLEEAKAANVEKQENTPKPKQCRQAADVHLSPRLLLGALDEPQLKVSGQSVERAEASSNSRVAWAIASPSRDSSSSVGRNSSSAQS